MKLLFKAIFLNYKHMVLLLITVFSMCLVTVSSQLEIFTFGVITKKGPEFFELFGPIEEGKLKSTDKVTREAMLARWDQLDQNRNGYVDKAETAQFISKWKNRDLIDSAINKLNEYFPLSNNLLNLALMIIIVAIFKAITMFTHRYSTRLVAIGISRDLRQAYFEHIQSLPMSFYQGHHIGSLSTRVLGDAAMIAEAINACLVNYLQTPFVVISTLTLCFLTSWELSLIIFLGFPLIIFPIIFLAKRVKRVSKQIQQNQEKFASVLIDFIAGIQTVKVFAMEDFSLKKYKDQNERMAALEKKSARYDLSTRPIVHTIAMFFLSTAMMYGLYVLSMSVSEILLYCGWLYLFYEPIKKFAEENSHIQRGIAAAERMYEVMSIQPNTDEKQSAVDLEKFEDQIEFDRVWFRYEDQWILKDLSFKINKGETVAIVGPTGAGKSTIVQLIPRLYDIQKGEIRINGKSITTYSSRSLRERIAFVPQKPFLFLDTISKNISFGRNFTSEDVLEAAKNAHADEFICQLPEGYETVLAEAGKNLSGGQQQRLAIARALVKKAPILVMDEATSSLDPVSENYIKTAIRQLHGKVTQIIIAHRLSTIEHADKIIYLEKGRKVAEGTKDELLKSCTGFRIMWEMMHNASSS